jgi:hypothetical protein
MSVDAIGTVADLDRIEAEGGIDTSSGRLVIDQGPDAGGDGMAGPWDDAQETSGDRNQPAGPWDEAVPETEGNVPDKDTADNQADGGPGTDSTDADGAAEAGAPLAVEADEQALEAASGGSEDTVDAGETVDAEEPGDDTDTADTADTDTDNDNDDVDIDDTDADGYGGTDGNGGADAGETHANVHAAPDDDGDDGDGDGTRVADTDGTGEAGAETDGTEPGGNAQE